jgi:hypothetical protein
MMCHIGEFFIVFCFDHAILVRFITLCRSFGDAMLRSRYLFAKYSMDTLR